MRTANLNIWVSVTDFIYIYIPTLQAKTVSFSQPICVVNMNIMTHMTITMEGSLEVKFPTIWTDKKQSREEAERRRVEEKE